MSLFSMFKSAPALELTPRKALAVALLYCMGSDGEIDPEEVGHLLSVLGRGTTRDQFDQIVKYVRATPPDAFLEQVTPRLNQAQRLCILLNMIDSAMADGQAEAGEQELIATFQRAFGLDDATLEPYFRALVAKNGRTVLDV